ncbi:MAG: recombination regulator RecX [Treponema sp.]|nr:recombination regulator RecX [Treponema sp.]
MFKIQAVENEEELTFFVRDEYLPEINIYDILPGSVFDEVLSGQLMDAGLSCAAELKAVEYLSRAEQSRSGLLRKLLQKKYEKKYIESALDFLEQKNYLSDSRFSRAWLNTRKINHYEGPSKLCAELQARGIDKATAEAAVSEFFTENDEYDICRKALEKQISKGKKDEKLIASMLQAGFSYKMIREVMLGNES